MQHTVMTLHVDNLGSMPPGDREQVAKFLHEQADHIMNNGPNLGESYTATIMDDGESFVRGEVSLSGGKDTSVRFGVTDG